MKINSPQVQKTINNKGVQDDASDDMYTHQLSSSTNELVKSQGKLKVKFNFKGILEKKKEDNYSQTREDPDSLWILGHGCKAQYSASGTLTRRPRT